MWRKYGEDMTPCLWREKVIYSAMSIARKSDAMSIAKKSDSIVIKSAMSMVRMIKSCLWLKKRLYFWTRSSIPTLLCSFLPLACDWGPHEVDELLVFAGLRDQWCKECPQEMITTLEGRKSLEGLWALNFPAPVEKGLSWSLGFPLLFVGSFRGEVGF